MRTSLDSTAYLNPATAVLAAAAAAAAEGNGSHDDHHIKLDDQVLIQPFHCRQNDCFWMVMKKITYFETKSNPEKIFFCFIFQGDHQDGSASFLTYDQGKPNK